MDSSGRKVAALPKGHSNVNLLLVEGEDKPPSTPQRAFYAEV